MSGFKHGNLTVEDGRYKTTEVKNLFPTSLCAYFTPLKSTAPVMVMLALLVTRMVLKSEYRLN